MSTAINSPSSPNTPPDGESAQAVAEQEYRQLVFATVSGTTFATWRLQQTCFTAQRTAVDFDRHVAVMRKRIAAAEEVAEIPGLDQAIADAVANVEQIGEEDRALAAKIQELRDKANIAQRFREAEAAVGAARNCRTLANQAVQLLLRTSNNAGEERIRQLSDGLMELHNDRSNHARRKVKLADMEEKYVALCHRVKVATEGTDEHRDLSRRMHRDGVVLRDLRTQVAANTNTAETDRDMREEIQTIRDARLDPRAMRFDAEE